MSDYKIGVVIPCFRVKEHILPLLESLGPEVARIYLVDDACPEGTGQFVQNKVNDSRLRIILSPENRGVGGAVMLGYRQALQEDLCNILVKLDGDGQMDPKLILSLVKPITSGKADYTKGNRYFSLEDLVGMPKLRLIGNAVLSFINKISSGYWSVMDPTNGFTAIHTHALRLLPLEKISQRYFFESDMLFRLNCLRAVIKDVPMKAHYGLEKSHLQIHKIILEFAVKHIINFQKRIFYNYFLRDFSIASVEMVVGAALLAFGTVYGAYNWIEGIHYQKLTPTGKIFLAALPILLGVQLLLSALNYDMSREPTDCIH